MAVGSISHKSFHLFCLEKPEGEAAITSSADILYYGDETQKLWKPLLTQFSPEEAHRSGRCNEADEVIAASPSSLRTIE